MNEIRWQLLPDNNFICEHVLLQLEDNIIHFGYSGETWTIHLINKKNILGKKCVNSVFIQWCNNILIPSNIVSTENHLNFC